MRRHNVISRENVRHTRRICIVGGDPPEARGGDVPTIVVEKDSAGNIARIVVNCPCGQSAELVCCPE
jgi:hypothetical protein